MTQYKLYRVTIGGDWYFVVANSEQQAIDLVLFYGDPPDEAWRKLIEEEYPDRRAIEYPMDHPYWLPHHSTPEPEALEWVRTRDDKE